MLHRGWESRMEPFRGFGNLYFVGTEPASAHLIDTGTGLILLDSGYPETLYLVLDSIRRLGFRLEDLALILHSHGHIDHIGGTRALVELTGAKTAIGAADADTVRGRRPLTFAKELGMTFDGFFEPDRLLQDGDVIALGSTRITCLHTPHGAQKSSGSSPALPPAIATATKSRSPFAIAVKNAVRSAQFVGVNAAFSMFTPVYISPLFASSAAPAAEPV